MPDIDSVTNVQLPDMSGNSTDKDISLKQRPKGVLEKKRPGFLKWLTSHFMAMKPRDILDNVFENVVDPGLRQFASNVIDEAKNLFLFGEEGSGGTNYTRYGRSSDIRGAAPSKKEKTRGNFTNVEMFRREDALEVRKRLLERIAEYNEVTVSYFYEQCGFDSNDIDYTDEAWGWTKFPNGLNVIPTPNGKYKLNLPDAKPLAK